MRLIKGKIDNEIQAMRAVFSIFEDLKDPRARTRVLEWAQDRYGSAKEFKVGSFKIEDIEKLGDMERHLVMDFRGK